MNITDILKVGKTRIEKGWTQNAYCRDAEHRPLPIEDPDACCWCAAGAIGNDGNAAKLLVNAILDVGGRVNAGTTNIGAVASWNDWQCRSKEDVLKVFDIAIAKAEGTPCPAKNA